MKYLKLVTTIIISLFMLSCNNKEQTSDDISIDKKLVVKELLTEFVKSVKDNKKYNDFYLEKSNLQSKGNSIQVTEEEIKYLLNSLPAKFINLYNQVKDIDLTQEEFMRIANEYDYLLEQNQKSYSIKGPIPNDQACGVSIAITNIPFCGGCILGWIGRWVHC